MAKPLSILTPTLVLERLSSKMPEARCEPYHVNLFTLVVAVVLSAQTQEKMLERACRSLFAAASEPQDMIALGEDGVASHIATLGLYRSKARNVFQLSKMLVDAYGGHVPLVFDELVKLPGVGRKTANVIQILASGAEVLGVDTHVLRVSRRLGLATGRTPTAVERELIACIPNGRLAETHHLFVTHGRLTCRARHPHCDQCCLNDMCRFFLSNSITPGDRK